MDKQQKLIIKIALIIVSIICIISITIFLNKDKLKKGQFIIPEIEQNAIAGKPNFIAKDLMYTEAKVNDNYIVYLCAAPKTKENILTLFFTSVKTNTELIKIKILDSKNNVLGESGLLKPDSYLKDIELNRKLEDKEKITIKVMGYEKDTYYSQGSIKLDIFVKKNKD